MKEKIKKMIHWLLSWDERLWKDQLTSKSYLGTISILVAAVAGVVLTIVEGGLDDSFLPYILVLVLVNVVESVLIAKTWKAAVTRSLVMGAATVVAMLAGIALVAIVALVLLITFAGFILSLVGGGGVSGGSSRGRRITIDGEEVTESSDLVGLGKTYESKSSGRKWRSTDGSDNVTEE